MLLTLSLKFPNVSEKFSEGKLGATYTSVELDMHQIQHACCDAGLKSHLSRNLSNYDVSFHIPLPTIVQMNNQRMEGSTSLPRTVNILTRVSATRKLVGHQCHQWRFLGIIDTGLEAGTR